MQLTDLFTPKTLIGCADRFQRESRSAQQHNKYRPGFNHGLIPAGSSHLTLTSNSWSALQRNACQTDSFAAKKTFVNNDSLTSQYLHRSLWIGALLVSINKTINPAFQDENYVSGSAQANITPKKYITGIPSPSKPSTPKVVARIKFPHKSWVAWLTPRFLRGNHGITIGVFLRNITFDHGYPTNDRGENHATHL